MCESILKKTNAPLETMETFATTNAQLEMTEIMQMAQVQKNTTEQVSTEAYQDIKSLQPQQLHGAAAVAPVQVPEQQRQLSDKETHKQEKKVQQKEKKLAQAKIKLDQVFNQMKNDPTQAKEYHSVRSTETYSDRAAYLEQLILSQITDETQARELLDKVRTFANYAQQYDKSNQDFRFRIHSVPHYIETVLKKKVTPEMEEQLERESDAWSEAKYGTEMIRLFEEATNAVYANLNPEQVEQQKHSGVRNEQNVAYKNELKDLMENQGLTEREARNQFAETQLHQKRPVTLRKIEEQRAKKFKREKEMDDEAYFSVEWANKLIQKQDPNAPVLDWEKADRLVKDYMRAVMKKSTSYQIRIPNSIILKKIMEAGRLRTQMETNTSKAALDVGQRKNFTKEAFGAENISPEQYEIYGYLSHGDMVREGNLDNADNVVGNGVGQYGQMIIKLKNSVMEHRTTMSVGDSLSSQFNSHVTKANMPDLQAVGGKHRTDTIVQAYNYDKNRKQPGADTAKDIELDTLLGKAGCAYLELQYHGGVSLEDIESVTLLADYKGDGSDVVEKEIPPELVKQLKGMGIRATVVRGGQENEL